jgi:hypothetical protein
LSLYGLEGKQEFFKIFFEKAGFGFQQNNSSRDVLGYNIS